MLCLKIAMGYSILFAGSSETLSVKATDVRTAGEP